MGSEDLFILYLHKNPLEIRSQASEERVPELLITPGKGRLGNTHLEDTPQLDKPSSNTFCDERKRRPSCSHLTLLLKLVNSSMLEKSRWSRISIQIALSLGSFLGFEKMHLKSILKSAQQEL